MNKTLITASALIFTGMLSACSGMGGKATATAELAPTQGNATQGSVQFVQQEDGRVKVTAQISGLTPGVHGFHIHEKGDCSAPDGTSAGGHYNPFKQAHGKANEGAHHVGDLPSLEADANGNATLDALVEGVPLTGENTIVGRGLIVHAAPDDFVTQPTGNAGARVACAVIKSK
ncbi:MAG: superoxide dismutase family protein [Azoarcus sp.]|jgi:Cu-Zn family superoxide dismutase|nr:superoxide dismutase family protein [Azoarcus sp.]